MYMYDRIFYLYLLERNFVVVVDPLVHAFMSSLEESRSRSIKIIRNNSTVSLPCTLSGWTCSKSTLWSYLA